MLGRRRIWQEIYEYYVAKGLFIFILDNVVSLLIGVAISAAPILLFGCCDFSKISTAKHLSDMIVSFPEGVRRCNMFVLACSLVFTGFNILKLAQFVIACPRFFRMHNYFTKKWEISDSELGVASWNHVIEAILVREPEEHRSALSIVQDILRFDNYICALVSDPSILTWRMPGFGEVKRIQMTEFFFHLFELGLSGVVLESSGGSMVNGVHAVRAPVIAKRLSSKFRLIGGLLAIFSPFVMCFEILYLVFQYSQSIRSSPESLSLRRWTPQSKWIIREYNELPHLLNERVAKSYEFAGYYMELFPSYATQLIFKVVGFFSGALITIFFVVGLVTDSGYLLSIEAFGGRSLAWFISVLASIYGVCRVSIASEVRPYTADECMTEMEKYIHFDFRDGRNSAQSWESFCKFSDFFKSVAAQLATEMFSVILNPFLFIVVLPFKAEAIVDFVRRNSVQDPNVGWICSFSAFDETRRNASGSLEQEEKLQRSIRNFAFGHESSTALIELQDPLEVSAAPPRTVTPIFGEFNSEDIMREFTCQAGDSV